MQTKYINGVTGHSITVERAHVLYREGWQVSGPLKQGLTRLVPPSEHVAKDKKRKRPHVHARGGGKKKGIHKKHTKGNKGNFSSTWAGTEIYSVFVRYWEIANSVGPYKAITGFQRENLCSVLAAALACTLPIGCIVTGGKNPRQAFKYVLRCAKKTGKVTIASGEPTKWPQQRLMILNTPMSTMDHAGDASMRLIISQTGGDVSAAPNNTVSTILAGGVSALLSFLN